MDMWCNKLITLCLHTSTNGNEREFMFSYKNHLKIFRARPISIAYRMTINREISPRLGGGAILKSREDLSMCIQFVTSSWCFDNRLYKRLFGLADLIYNEVYRLPISSFFLLYMYPPTHLDKFYHSLYYVHSTHPLYRLLTIHQLSSFGCVYIYVLSYKCVYRKKNSRCWNETRV